MQWAASVPKKDKMMSSSKRIGFWENLPIGQRQRGHQCCPTRIITVLISLFFYEGDMAPFFLT
jgi:hypothetical protein